MRKRNLAMGLVMLCVLAGMATMAQATLVAQWTFMDTNDSSTEDATNDTLTLTPGGGSAELLTTGEYASGVLKTVSGGMANVLRSDELSFQSGDTFTVWARIRFDHTEAKCYELFRNETGSGGFTFRVDDSSDRPLRFRAASSVTAGLYVDDTDWHNVGIRVFTDGSNQKIEFYMDGASTGSLISLFSDYGRDYDIAEAGGSGYPIYVEEMRVYDTFLSDSEMDAIEYVVPEPATMCLLAVGGLSVLARRKR